MVWEHNVSVIAMLTREFENGNCKCSGYWPSNSSTYGPFLITQTNITENSHQVLHRSFQIVHIQSEASRTVEHFQYTGWPDHGLPESPEAFIYLVDALWASNVTKGPLVVHCSAGIGRTGTLCCVDIVTHLLQTQYKDNLNGQPPEFFRQLVFNTVLELRKQRVGMVQTREQYYYCYLAVLAMNSPSFRKLLIKRKKKFDEQQAEAAREAALMQAQAMEEAMMRIEGGGRGARDDDGDGDGRQQTSENFDDDVQQLLNPDPDQPIIDF